MDLIAVWEKGKDEYYDAPSIVRWADGRPATLKDYERHQNDTRQLIDKGPRGRELHIWPNIVAEVYFCPWGEVWGIRGDDVVSTALDLTYRNSTDEQIMVAMGQLSPITYRYVISR